MKIKNGTTVQADRLAVSFSVKADSIDKDARTFEGLASVWGRDLGDDDMHKGAFKETLKEWRSSGRTIALLNNHNHWDITSAIGQLLEAKETDEGLWTKWEVIDGPDGDRVLERIRPSPRTGKAIVTKMSIGFNIIRYEIERTDKARWGEIRHLHEVELLEVSLVLFPMAPGASVDASSVKQVETLLRGMDRKSLRRTAKFIGRRLSGTKNAAATPDDEEDASAAAEATSEDAPTSPNTPPAEQPASDSAPVADAEENTAPQSDPPAPTGEVTETSSLDPLLLEALQVRMQRVLNHSSLKSGETK